MRVLASVIVGILALGCDKRAEPEGEAPPPVSLKSPCEAAPHTGPLAVRGLPGRAAGHCIDPTADIRSYGTGAKAPLDAVCVELFNGECELYKSYGLDGVKTLRYAPLSSQKSFVGVVLSEFRSQAGAYGFFTRRILGGAPPEERTVEPLSVAGQGALGVGVAYIRRGKTVVELTYISETETPREVEKSARSVLAPLATAMAETLGGPEHPPGVAQVTQLSGAEPLSTELPPDGLLGLVGTGPFAVTHYPGPDFRYRLVALEALDEAGAKDALRLVRGAGASHKLKQRDIFSVRVARDELMPEIWHFRAQGRLLLGVGPGQGESAPATVSERKAVEERWTVFALGRLSALSRHALSLPEDGAVTR